MNKFLSILISLCLIFPAHAGVITGRDPGAVRKTGSTMSGALTMDGASINAQGNSLAFTNGSISDGRITRTNPVGEVNTTFITYTDAETDTLGTRRVMDIKADGALSGSIQYRLSLGGVGGLSSNFGQAMQFRAGSSAEWDNLINIGHGGTQTGTIFKTAGRAGFIRTKNQFLIAPNSIVIDPAVGGIHSFVSTGYGLGVYTPLTLGDVRFSLSGGTSNYWQLSDTNDGAGSGQFGFSIATGATPALIGVFGYSPKDDFIGLSRGGSFHGVAADSVVVGADSGVMLLESTAGTGFQISTDEDLEIFSDAESTVIGSSVNVVTSGNFDIAVGLDIIVDSPGIIGGALCAVDIGGGVLAIRNCP